MERHQATQNDNIVNSNCQNRVQKYVVPYYKKLKLQYLVSQNCMLLSHFVSGTSVSLSNCYNLVSLSNCYNLVSLSNCYNLVSLSNCYNLVSLSNCYNLVSPTNCYNLLEIGVFFGNLQLIRNVSKIE